MRIAKAVVRQIDHYPYLMWEERIKWEDDESEDACLNRVDENDTDRWDLDTNFVVR